MHANRTRQFRQQCKSTPFFPHSRPQLCCFPDQTLDDGLCSARFRSIRPSNDLSIPSIQFRCGTSIDIVDSRTFFLFSAKIVMTKPKSVGPVTPVHGHAAIKFVTQYGT